MRTRPLPLEGSNCPSFKSGTIFTVDEIRMAMALVGQWGWQPLRCGSGNGNYCGVAVAMVPVMEEQHLWCVRGDNVVMKIHFFMMTGYVVN